VPAPRRLTPLGELVALRATRGPEAAVRKATLLAALLRRPPTSTVGIRRAHDAALFLTAFPDDAAVFDAARRVLDAVGGWVRQLPASRRHRLDDTGLDGTVTSSAFAWPIAAWLGHHAPHEADIDWPRLRDPSQLDALLRPLLVRAEEDEFDSGEIGTRDWMRLAEGPGDHGDLAWLATQAEDCGASREWQGLWDALQVPIRWRLSHAWWSVTHARLGGARPRDQWRSNPMRRLPANPISHIRNPHLSITRLAAGAATDVIDLARAALAARAREVHAVTYANPDDVWLADIGEHVHVAVIGVAPEWRLSLEGNYAWLGISHGVPIAYGGVSPLVAQANTGIHVFDAFRGSEAAFLWMSALRTFAALFGTKRFVVNPVQVGEDNDDAIASGAFWFYWRVGFRPTDPAIADLAVREAARLVAHPKRRTAVATLRKLATADLALTLPGFRARDAFDERHLATIAHGVTTRLGEASVHGHRLRTLAQWRAEVAEVLGAPGRLRWTPAQVRAFDRLAPVVALVLDDVRTWPAADRRALLAMMRAKGSPSERDYARAMPGATRFWRAIRRWAQRMLRDAERPTPRP
jgi:hypothetical protein